MTLTWLLLIPFIGGLLAWQMERAGKDAPRHVALSTSLLLVAVSIGLWVNGTFSYSAGEPVWFAEFRAPWIERFGISFHLALDGLGLVMILLTGILGAVAVLASWKEVSHRTGLFHLNFYGVPTVVCKADDEHVRGIEDAVLVDVLNETSLADLDALDVVL